MEDPEKTQRNKLNRKIHPKKKACCLSHLLFCWELPIILRGWKTEITEDDLFLPLEEHSSSAITNQLEHFWKQEEILRKKPSLTRALFKTFGLEFVLCGLIMFPADLSVTLLQPIFLRKLLDYFESDQKVSREEAYMYATAMVALSATFAIIFHSVFLKLQTLGMKIRIACSSLIYRKILMLRQNTLQKVTLGHIVNLLSNDVERFDLAIYHLHYIWFGLTKLIVSIFYINGTLGYTGTVGLPVIFLSILVQMFTSKKISKAKRAVATAADYRIRLIDDIIGGIQLIKISVWEKSFIELVTAARKIELKRIRKANNLRLCCTIIRVYVAKVSVFFCILTATLSDMVLTPQYVFPLLSIYENLKVTITQRVSMALIRYADARVSVLRVQEFLLVDHESKDNLTGTIKFASPESPSNFFPFGVDLRNVCAKWDESLPNYCLEGIDFQASSGQLVAVIGAAGSGKSTLLQVLLKELELGEGTLEINGIISYASQEPWIFSASVRQNILLGDAMDEEKYSKVIKVTGLEYDVSQFPYGDKTLVGERGVMLSGGQKARINLARAIYKDADIYLLDDPLSAVDTNVAQHIFTECIEGYLKDKCIILVTHQLQYLKQVERIYILKKGRVVGVGKYEELDLENQSFQLEEKTDETKETVTIANLTGPVEIKEHRGVEGFGKSYINFHRSGGNCIITFFVLFLFVSNQSVACLIDLSITYWLSFKEQLQTNPLFSIENCLYIYSGLVIILVLKTHATVAAYVRYCLNASKNLHEKLLKGVIGTNLKFFHEQLSGRILNRFSKDVNTVDELIPERSTDTFVQFLTLISATIVTSILNYWMIIPSIIFYGIIFTYFVLFEPSNKSIRRTEGTAKSPIINHMTATLRGLTTIKAFKIEKKLQDEFDGHQDFHTSAYYLFRAFYITFAFWTDVSCTLYTVTVITSFFFFDESLISKIGLIITMVLSMGDLGQLGMKMWSELDSHLTSVDRIVEYARLPEEADEGSFSPDRSWPSTGNIVFDSVSMRYSDDMPLVLKQISFEIRNGEKIGIVGRTGSGKTSLISVLFRLFDFEGKVLIDDVDTKSVPLSLLRSKISIITQDPVLFLGTIRRNLDPFGHFVDSQLWEALEEVQMRETVSDLPSNLDFVVAEGGSNFSVGQRQLLCLVRTMLRNARIIVLDEVTANVDLKTDELIQSTIRRKFQHCTVLTIAHRLNTVVDSDKILVVSNGNVIDFGPPERVLQGSKSY